MPSSVRRAPPASALAPLAAAFIAFTVVRAGPARAGSCAPRTHQSTCFDADALWVPAAPSRFIGVPRARALEVGTFALGIDATYLSRPVVLSTLSPDPAGRDVRVVDDVVDGALSGAYSPVRHLELTLVIPATLFRTGTGLTGVTSQSGTGLSAQAFRDVRLGAAHDLWSSRDETLRADLSTRLELSLPTGASSAFAGERTALLAPGFVLGVERGRFFGAAELGARLRRPVEIGGSRLGTEIVSTLGIGLHILGDGRLSGALEAWVFSSMLSQRRTFADGVAVTDGNSTPAEWMLSVQSRRSDFVLSLGGGTALPLSSETRHGANGAEAIDQFAGVTSPRFRGALVIRYSPVSPP